MRTRTSLHALLEDSADDHGAAVALSDRKGSVTYEELWALATRVGAALRGLGCEREDRVAVYLDKRVETVATIFGASAAGAAFVPVNPVLRARQVAHIVDD